jgi:hypothetical protein
MTRVTDRDAGGASTRQRARLTIKAGRRARLTLDVTMTRGGIVAVGGLVAAILLSTAVLVGVAGRSGYDQRRMPGV